MIYRVKEALQGAGGRPDVKQKDLELWRQWKKSQNPQDLQKLLDQMQPIISREVNKWAGAMSRSLLEAEAKRLAVEAFKSYDPNQGTALSTYVASRLPKLSRMVYATQNTARLSETKALLFHTYNTATNELRDKHGREPTNEELADHLGWSKKKLEQFQRQATRKEFIESEEHPDHETAEDHLADFIYHDLTPLQKQIFEYTTGYGGKPKLSGKEIMSKLGVTQGQLSYQKSLIVKKVEEAQQVHGL
jgi:DNA-directed RNA polymerase specialized sigma subunit